MIDAAQFADKQLELAAEFGKFVFDHPEMDDLLRGAPVVYFQIDGEPEFNAHSRELAEQKRRTGGAVLLVRTRGLAPLQGSRLIDPVVEPLDAVA
jgi:hypothetical protein